jgi:hypothetical protein
LGFRFWLSTVCLLALCLNLVQIVHGQEQTNETNKVPTGKFESKAFTVRDLKAVYHDGDYEISGTIKNITNESITGAAIILVYYNSEESVQTNVHPIDSVLEPGQEYSFEISPYRIGLDLDHYKITMMSDR